MGNSSHVQEVTWEETMGARVDSEIVGPERGSQSRVRPDYRPVGASRTLVFVLYAEGN